MVVEYIQDNIIKEKNHKYIDRDSNNPYRYIGTTGVSFVLNDKDWVPAFQEEPEQEEEITFIDIKAEPHKIFVDKCSSDIDIYIKYLKRFVETLEDKIAERVRYSYSLLVIGENTFRLNDNVDIINVNGVSYIHAKASGSLWNVENEMEMYIRQFDGAKYPYSKPSITGNIDGVTYDVSGNLTFNIVTDETERDFPSVLDRNNNILDITILGTEQKTLTVSVGGDINSTYNISAEITKKELSTMIGENNLLPVVVRFHSDKFGMDFQNVLYIRKEDIPQEPDGTSE